jgi:hypothetical protein
MDGAERPEPATRNGQPAAKASGRVRAAAFLRYLRGTPQVWAWVAVWILTRAFILAHVGFWHAEGSPEYEDVSQYELWAQQITAAHALPMVETWQYPPGAAFLMLVPRLTGGSYGESFVILMLLFDLVCLGLLARLGRREGSYVGVWVWLLFMPALAGLPVLRFDLAPTVAAVAAMVVLHKRPAWFGALVGIGSMLKAWPVVLLFGEWDRRKLVRAVLATLAAIAAILVATAVLFSHPLGFLGEENGRGLQVEAVASIPWHLREIVTGREVPEVLRYGAWEVDSSAADTVAELLKWCSLLALAGAAAWWILRDRSIRRGYIRLGDVAIARDFVFTVVLLLLVTSRVLSPQYMIWVLGMAAVVLTATRCHVKRPAWTVLAALLLTTSAFTSQVIIIRDMALVIAAVDASITMCLLLARPPAPPLATRAGAAGGASTAAGS